jgi:hypothetical protein
MCVFSIDKRVAIVACDSLGLVGASNAVCAHTVTNDPSE